MDNGTPLKRKPKQGNRGKKRKEKRRKTPKTVIQDHFPESKISGASS